MRVDGSPVSAGTIERMTGLLFHRGPDSSGFHIAEGSPAGLGHRRLSIIDLQGGAQPMCVRDGTLWITYNGEVYNFPELREELEGRGHKFSTRSDTEVILHQYEEDGPECLCKFNGMFAFAIWDSRKRELFLARDRMGIKPLYYFFDGKRFLFASEITPILSALPELPGLDMGAVWSYLAVQYAPAPRTLFRGISELEPGHSLVVNREGVSKHCYWRLPDRGEPRVSGRDAEEEIRWLLEDSVRMRLVSDVPLGAFLSGGIDSTALVAFMKRHVSGRLTTFSVDFHADLGAGYVNETRWSRLASETFATEHHPLTISASEALDCLPAVVARMDDLVSDPAVIPLFLVSRFARERVTVALSGEGGDELFGGYQRYRLGALARFYNPAPRFLQRFLFEWPALRLPRTRRVIKALRALSADDPAGRHLSWLAVMPSDVIHSLMGNDAGFEEQTKGVFEPFFRDQAGTYDLDRVLRADLSTWLPGDLLTKVDRASMAVGLECRVPFLDHRLVELCDRIPARDKAGIFFGKKVFKRAMKGVAPDRIIRRKKAGFTLPLDQWFRSELKDMLQDLLHPDRVRDEGVFDPRAVQSLVSQHLSGRENQGHQLFSLLIFQMWRDSIKGQRAG